MKSASAVIQAALGRKLDHVDTEDYTKEVATLGIESYKARQAEYDQKVERYRQDEAAYLRRREADPDGDGLEDEFAALVDLRKELAADYERVRAMRDELARERDSALDRALAL